MASAGPSTWYAPVTTQIRCKFVNTCNSGGFHGVIHLETRTCIDFATLLAPVPSTKAVVPRKAAGKQPKYAT